MTWNAGHRKDSWELLRSFDADVVLAQELPPPPPKEVGRTAYCPFADTGTRRWGTAIWVRDRPFRRLRATTSRTYDAREGIASVAEIDLTGGGVLTAVSLHAADDKISKRGLRKAFDSTPKGYAVTTMHRALSDLTGYLDDSRRSTGRDAVVLGGDLNCNLAFDEEQRNPSHALVFARVAAFGLKPVVPVIAGSTHVTITRERIPHRQIDYLYASERVKVEDRGILRTQQMEERRDHLPVWAHLSL